MADTRTITVANKICGFYNAIGAQMEYHWIHKYGNTLCLVGCINKGEIMQIKRIIIDNLTQATKYI